MSEDPTIPADVPVEEAQSAAEPTDAPPPWGDDFDAARAWQTITHLRGRETELEAAAKQYERLKSDPDAQREFLADLGYEVEDDYEEEPDNKPDPEFASVKQQLEELATWKNEREAREREAAFNADLDRLAETAEVELDAGDREWIAFRASRDPEKFGPETVKQAFDELHARYEAKSKAYLDRVKSGKKSSSVTPAGTAAAPTPPNLDDQDARVKFMLERMTGGGQST